MTKSLYTIWVFALISIRRYFRDRVAIFFTVVFPLIFLLIFGSLTKGNNISVHVGLIDQGNSGFAQKLDSDIKANKTFKVDSSIQTLDQANEKMSRGEVDATLVIPPDFGKTKVNNVPSGQLVIYYDENSAQAAQTVKSVIDGELEHYNSHIVMIQTPFTARLQSTNTQGLSKLDYTVSGLIGFSILGLGVFGPVNYFPQMKKQGVLRRLHITPLRPWEFFVSSVVSNAVIGLLSIAIMLVVASTLFHFKMVGNYFELALVVLLSILNIFGIGLAIGGWAKNENQAAPIANLVSFPMMFLSGSFFPRFAMAPWLQHISAYFPLTPVIDSIRIIATEGKHLTDIGPQIGMIGVWTIIIYLIAFRVFRWE